MLLTVFFVAACDKGNDVPRMQAEALEIAKSYQARFDDLSRRASAIPRDRLSTADAQWAYGQAISTLDRFRNELQQVPVMVQAGAKSGNPEELEKLIDSMHERFEAGVIDATAKLSAVESWLAIAEHQGGQTPRTPDPGPGETPPAESGSPAPDR
ncbi:MAG TPA: hypothetical protein VFT22_30950 [Kofleriaceae bacterium]|nr:hypothetical protein [Kofleriaceae bacterium]